jgi:hypothetical protein
LNSKANAAPGKHWPGSQAGGATAAPHQAVRMTGAGQDDEAGAPRKSGRPAIGGRSNGAVGDGLGPAVPARNCRSRRLQVVCAARGWGMSLSRVPRPCGPPPFTSFGTRPIPTLSSPAPVSQAKRCRQQCRTDVRFGSEGASQMSEVGCAALAVPRGTSLTSRWPRYSRHRLAHCRISSDDRRRGRSWRSSHLDA